MSLLHDLLSMRAAKAAAIPITEGRHQYFEHEYKMSFDPDRFETYSVADSVVRGLVLAAYVDLKEKQEKHEKMYADEPETKFEFTKDALRDSLEDLTKGIREALDRYTNAQLDDFIEGSKLPSKLD
jgi:hypothetical protein